MRGGERPVPPGPRAPHAEWLEYAVGRGMDQAHAAGLTRDQLRLAFARAIDGEVDLERHERNPEALAARDAGRS